MNTYTSILYTLSLPAYILLCDSCSPLRLLLRTPDLPSTGTQSGAVLEIAPHAGYNHSYHSALLHLSIDLSPFSSPPTLRLNRLCNPPLHGHQRHQRAQVGTVLDPEPRATRPLMSQALQRRVSSPLQHFLHRLTTAPSYIHISPQAATATPLPTCAGRVCRAQSAPPSSTSSTPRPPPTGSSPRSRQPSATARAATRRATGGHAREDMARLVISL